MVDVDRMGHVLYSPTFISRLPCLVKILKEIRVIFESVYG